MVFPKAIMTVTELNAFGFDRTYISQLTKVKGQRYCWKKNPAKVCSTILFDTAELAKYIESQQKLLSDCSRAKEVINA